MSVADDFNDGTIDLKTATTLLVQQSTIGEVPPNYVSIDGYLIDAALSEQHTFDAEITDHPVETGSDVTDNVRVRPAVVTITGIVSDTPLGPLVEQRANEASEGSEGLPSDAALARLLAIQTAREPITIITSRKLFDDMMMQHLDVPVDANTGRALHFTATFKQIIFVTNDRQLIRVANPQNAAGSNNLGNISAKDAPGGPGGYYSINNPDGADTSLLGQGVDSIGGVHDKITPESFGNLMSKLGL